MSESVEKLLSLIEKGIEYESGTGEHGIFVWCTDMDKKNLIATVRRLLKVWWGMSDENVHVIPIGNREPQHEDSAECWCEPELKEDYTEDGGRKLYVHREMQ